MKRRLLLLLLTASLALAAPLHADVFLIGFEGYDYEDPDANDPDPDGATYLEVGDGYKMVGFATSFGLLLAPYIDASSYEYTNHMFDLTVTTHTWDSINQFLDVEFADNGRGRYYEDRKPSCGGCPLTTPGTPAPNPPTPNPPVAGQVPDKYIDGDIKIGGDIDNFTLYYDYIGAVGGFTGEMHLDEGTALIYIPVAQRNGWVLGGLLGRPNFTIPDGYDNQVTGECRIPVTPTTHTTWGSVKALYR